MKPEFFRFLVAGALNTGATYLLYLGLLHVLGYLGAYTVAYIAGLVLSYWLNAVFVFRVAPALSSLLKFPVVYVIQYLCGAATLSVAVEHFGIAREFALAIAIAVTIPITFFAVRFVLRGIGR